MASALINSIAFYNRIQEVVCAAPSFICRFVLRKQVVASSGDAKNKEDAHLIMLFVFSIIKLAARITILELSSFEIKHKDFEWPLSTTKKIYFLKGCCNKNINLSWCTVECADRHY